MTVDFIYTLPDENDWLEGFFCQHWGSAFVIVHEQIFRPNDLHALQAVDECELVGVASYIFIDDYCEIVSLDSLVPCQGLGSQLLQRVIDQARANECKTVRLTTTNDNLNALRFYQKRGFCLAALRSCAVAQSRLIKPEIPLSGEDGIPIRDELDLHLTL